MVYYPQKLHLNIAESIVTQKKVAACHISDRIHPMACNKCAYSLQILFIEISFQAPLLFSRMASPDS